MRSERGRNDGNARRATRSWLAGGLVGLLLTACGGPAYVMRDTTRPTPLARAEAATMLFAFAGNSRDTLGIVDEHGTLVGQLRAGAYFRAEVTPGRHRYYVVRGTAATRVDVPSIDAGMLGLIRYDDPVFTPFRARAVGLCEANDPELTAFLSSLQAVERPADADDAAVLTSLGSLARRVGEADRAFEALPAAERERVTLGASSCDP